MLNRDTPNLGPSKPPNDGADFTAPPAATTPEEAPPGKMGENMPPEREGPLNQGAASRTLRNAGEEELGLKKGNMNVRPDSAVEGSPETDVLDAESRGGAATIAQKRAQDPEEEDEEAEEGEEDESDETPDMVTSSRSRKPKTVTPSGPRLPPPGMPYDAGHFTRQDLKSAGNGAATIAATNFEGVVNERLKIIAEPGNDAAHRDVHYLAQKLLNRQIAFFRSEEEKSAVLRECRRITGLGQSMTDQERAAKDQERVDKGLPPFQPTYFQPLPESVRKNIVDHLVRGTYDAKGLLAGKQNHKQPVLNEVERGLMRNGTYLQSDSSRLMQKVRSLLPAAAPAAKSGATQQRSTQPSKPQQQAKA